MKIEDVVLKISLYPVSVETYKDRNFVRKTRFAIDPTVERVAGKKIGNEYSDFRTAMEDIDDIHPPDPIWSDNGQWRDTEIGGQPIKISAAFPCTELGFPLDAERRKAWESRESLEYCGYWMIRWS